MQTSISSYYPGKSWIQLDNKLPTSSSRQSELRLVWDYKKNHTVHFLSTITIKVLDRLLIQLYSSNFTTQQMKHFYILLIALFTTLSWHQSAAQTGITWESRTYLPDLNYKSVTYGNGLFVAVANSGTGNRVMTSPDGITWTRRTSAADNSWWSATYGNGLFAAVANTGSGNQIMTSGTIGPPLPLQWLSLSASLNNNDEASINWSVEEYDVLNYGIEKSRDGVNFKNIGTINCKGGGSHYYSFNDRLQEDGNTYYRIKQTDINGRYSISRVLMLNKNSLSRNKLHPNPASENIILSVPKNLIGKEVVIVNAAGSVAHKRIITQQAMKIDISYLQPGLYFIQMDNESPIRFYKSNQ